MKKIGVKSSQGGYEVLIGAGLLRQAGPLAAKAGVFPKGIVRGKTKAMLVSQAPVFWRYGSAVIRSLKSAGLQVSTYLLPAEGETAKTREALFDFYAALLKAGFERSDAIVALGGGVTGDAAGFAASTYLRGVPFVNLPTTLLAQVDSAIGGKTAINLNEGKNLVGTFYPPRLVIADTSALPTLSLRDYRASLAEVVKYGVIKDAKLFCLLEKNIQKLAKPAPALLENIVAICARIKGGVVSRDERETRGERMSLNYGHTFGHAFEKETGFRKLLHGEAVSIGMQAAGLLALELGLWPQADAERQGWLLASLGLPVSLRGFSVKTENVMRAMLHDKKKQAGRLRFILPVRIGKVTVCQDIPAGLIRRVLHQLGGL